MTKKLQDDEILVGTNQREFTLGQLERAKLVFMFAPEWRVRVLKDDCRDKFIGGDISMEAAYAAVVNLGGIDHPAAETMRRAIDVEFRRAWTTLAHVFRLTRRELSGPEETVLDTAYMWDPKFRDAYDAVANEPAGVPDVTAFVRGTAAALLADARGHPLPLNTLLACVAQRDPDEYLKDPALPPGMATTGTDT